MTFIWMLNLFLEQDYNTSASQCYSNTPKETNDEDHSALIMFTKIFMSVSAPGMAWNIATITAYFWAI
jgi:hypothetical protein